MDLKTRIVKFFGGVTASEFTSVRKDLLSALEELERQESDEDVDFEKEMLQGFQALAKTYRKKGWVFAAVWRVATCAASVPLQVYRSDVERDEEGNEHEAVHPVLSHAAVAKLEKPNSYESGWLLRMRTFADLMIGGQAYWALEPMPMPGVKPEVLEVTSIRRLPPHMVEVVGDEKSFVKHFIYTVNGKRQTIPRERMVWFATYDPLNERGGIGPLEAARDALLLDEYAFQSNTRFFQNDGTPAGVIEPKEGTPKLSEAELTRYRSHWLQNFKGVKNKGRIAFVPPGYSFKPVSPSVSDMLFQEARKWSRLEMIAPFGVPPVLLGDLERATYSNMESALRYFYQFTIQPLMRLLVDALNAFYFPLFDANMWADFDISSFIAEDRRTQAETDSILVSTGIMTVDEAREARGLPPLGEVEKRQEIIYTPQDLEILKRADASVGKTLRKFVAGVRKTFEKQFSRWEERLREALAAGQAEAAVARLNVESLFRESADALADELAVVVTPVLMAAAKEAAKDFSGVYKIGISWDLIRDDVLDYIREKAAQASKFVTSTNIEHVRKELLEGLQLGEAEDELVERLQHILDVRWNQSQAIARTEIGFAYNNAFWEVGKKAYEQDLLQYKYWITALDERVRDSHRIHGQTRRIDEPFELVSGALLMYPGDTSLGADVSEIINCRCVVGYRTAEGQEELE